MISLRLQLLLGTTLGMTLVLLASCGALYVLVSRTLRQDFDQALAAKGRALASLVSQDEDGLELELADASLPEYAASARAEYYQFWLPDGDVFAASPSLNGETLDRIAEPSEIPAFRSIALPDGRPGRSVCMTFTPRHEEKAGFVPRPMTLTLVVERDVLDLRGTLTRIRGLLIGVCLSAVALAAVIQAWVVRRGLRPLSRLSRQIGEVGEHDLAARIDRAGLPLELMPVVDRLNDLLARLEAAFQRERRFTGDVAHELRTPLAGLRATLELALSRERTPEAYRAALGASLNIDFQMQRVVDNLLHLARTDAGQLELRREPVDVAKLIEECWKPFETRALQRGMRIEWRLDARDEIETDREKLRLVVQNILDNAVAHGDEGGRITVESSTRDGELVLVFGNASGRTAPADVRHVFERFWRADPSCHGENARHCGLGLPLCQAVLKHLDGSIEASIGAEGWFAVTIRLRRCSRYA